MIVRSYARLPAALWLIVAVHALNLVAHVALLPPYLFSDEMRHLDMVLAVNEEQQWPSPGGRLVSREVRASYDLTWGRGRGPRPDDEAIRRVDRPSFAELPDRPPTPYRNAAAQHPPLYYTAVAVTGTTLTTLLPPLGGMAFDEQLSLYRLFNVLLVVPVPLLAFLIARELTRRRSIPLAAAAATLAVPQFTRVGATVNNDNLLTLLAGVSLLLLVRLAKGWRDRRTLVALGLAVGLALFTKGFALILPPLVVAALLIGMPTARPWRWSRDQTGTFAGSLGLVAGVSAVLGGWWWLRNLVVHGAIQPQVRSFPSAAEDFDPSWAAWAGEWITTHIATFWGRFGFFNAPLERWWTLVLAVAVVAVGVVSALRARDRRAQVVLLLVPAVLVATLLILVSVPHYADTGRVQADAGRYQYPALAGYAAVVAFGFGRLLGRRAFVLPVVTLAVALYLQAIAGWHLLRQYGDGTGDVAETIRGALAWNPWHPAAVAAVAAALVVVSVAALAAVAMHARTEQRRLGSDVSKREEVPA